MEYLYYQQRTPQKMSKQDSEGKKNYANEHPSKTIDSDDNIKLAEIKKIDLYFGENPFKQKRTPKFDFKKKVGITKPGDYSIYSKENLKIHKKK